MIIHGRVFCDLCIDFLGQVWNEPACAPDLLPAPDFHVCDDCHSSSICTCGAPDCWFAKRGQCIPDIQVSTLGARPQLHPVRY